MSKGFNNFMSKKAFHPGSYANQKRVHEAEARAEAKRKHDEETLAQYQKEQELFNRKLLVSKESKDKLSLNFMYEPPPGIEKSEDKKNDKLEWKGSGPNASASGSGIKQKASSSRERDDSDDEPNLCLEWKRDKPTKNNSQETRKIKTEPDNGMKKEPKQEQKSEAREDHRRPEPDIKLEWKRDAKRIKKER